MDFYDVVDRAVDLLRSRGRVSYRALRTQFDLDDEHLGALTEELLFAHPGVIVEEERGLVWHDHPPVPAESTEAPVVPQGSDAERRQLTVLFCDLVDSTPLADRLDPEEWREVVRAYQDVCAKIIARFDGHIAQYLGDGLLVYFGYPRAHEDDAQRAVRAGLGMIEAVGQLNTTLTQKHGLSLAVRLGCHTGLVVVGEVGGGTRHEQLALGGTPNVAARLQGVAAPNTLVIGALTYQLLGGLFACQSLGAPTLKGVAQPIDVYQVLYESTARTRLEAIGLSGLTPLVGREPELSLLQDNWSQVLGGRGRVVLLSGEAGIGKSRLVQALTEHAAERQGWLIPCQCSPYYQHTAFYPLIDLFERVVLRFERRESAAQKLRKLEGFLVQTGLPLAEAVPHFASLLSIPLSDDYEPAGGTPEQQKQQTMRALLTAVKRRAANQPVLFVVEDLHWIDPTTLELISLFVDECHTARIMLVLTSRPDFNPPWAGREQITEVSLARLPHSQAAELTSRVAHGKSLPADVVAQVVAKTDGVPLFVEELTKMLIESGLLEEKAERYELSGPLPPLAIPNTLHDSLTARLDRLSTVKSLAQLGATLGREFSYALLQAVSPWGEGILQEGLAQLVTAEFLYQQGQPPKATYRFKHALIQDAAYQSLLKSTRQQHHQRIAGVLETQFPEVVVTQPELLARHYTEAGLSAQALPYWQAAGQQALAQSANREAASHATKGLEVLASLPESDDRTQLELAMQIMLGAALGATQGYQAVEHVYARACELARKVGSAPELFPALWGFWYSHLAQGDMHRARVLAVEFLAQSEQQDDPLIRAIGHRMLANTAWWAGELAEAREHSEAGLSLYDSQVHRAGEVSYGQDSGVCCGWIGALTSWVLGYPDQAVHTMEQTLARARELAHPFSVAQVMLFSAQLGQLRREPHAALEYADAALELCAEQGLDAYGNWSLLPRGWALAQLGQVSEGIADIRKALEGRLATGTRAVLPRFLASLGEAYGMAGRIEEGLEAMEQAVQTVQDNDERLYEAEVYRLKGELLLMRSVPDVMAAQACFRQAIDVARRQQAKSWELRAAVALGRLLQQKGDVDEARAIVAPLYDFFTEGFDTADLQEAEAFLAAL
ncbi:MAG TPA: AAA family ATPase [Mycobacterium sp.]|nr:AAA family ATPase [Mycobacterium sp.]